MQQVKRTVALFTKVDEFTDLCNIRLCFHRDTWI